MTLSMVYLRLTLLSAFAVLVLVCITYAHSGPNESEAIVALKGRSDCILSSARTVTGSNEVKNSAPEKTCD
jgi:hypothetical protein